MSFQQKRRITASKINGERHFKGLSVSVDSGESGSQHYRNTLTSAGELKAKANKTVTTLDSQKHGTTNTYNCGCRCDLCVLAHKLRHNL